MAACASCGAPVLPGDPTCVSCGAEQYGGYDDQAAAGPGGEGGGEWGSGGDPYYDSSFDEGGSGGGGGGGGRGGGGYNPGAGRDSYGGRGGGGGGQDYDEIPAGERRGGAGEGPPPKRGGGKGVVALVVVLVIVIAYIFLIHPTLVSLDQKVTDYPYEDQTYQGKSTTLGVVKSIKVEATSSTTITIQLCKTDTYDGSDCDPALASGTGSIETSETLGSGEYVIVLKNSGNSEAQVHIQIRREAF